MSGFNPRRIAMVVGMVLTNLVTSRLIHGLIFLPSIPSMIACPANVPVGDNDNGCRGILSQDIRSDDRHRVQNTPSTLRSSGRSDLWNNSPVIWIILIYNRHVGGTSNHGRNAR